MKKNYLDLLDQLRSIAQLPREYQQPHSSAHILYLCRYLGGSLRKSHESLDMVFTDPAVIRHWHKDHRAQAEAALQYR